MEVGAARRAEALLALVLERNVFQRGRIAPPDGPSAVELAHVPPLTRRELAEDQRLHPPFGTNLTYPVERYTHFHQTSGTAGRPLRVLDTPEDWAWWRGRLAHTYGAAGVGEGDRVALAFSFGPHIQFWAAKEGLDELGVMALPLGGMTSAQRLLTMADVAPTVLSCTPTYALRLWDVAVDHGLEHALEPIRLVICTGEPGASLPAVRSRIEEAFGARCLEHAGLSEAGNFGYPCTAGVGLHLDESEFVCEILDADLSPTPVGGQGELLLTPLGRAGFPVLRYRTGDVVVNSGERCPAGHADRWLPGGIVGRTDDMVVIRGMNVYPSTIEDVVRRVSGPAEFRITFYSEGGMEEVKLELELPDPGSVRRLQEELRQQLGLRVRVVPLAHGVLPRGEGKRRRVVDLRASGRPD
jgi:phenylacetate-CoA ligase